MQVRAWGIVAILFRRLRKQRSEIRKLKQELSLRNDEIQSLRIMHETALESHNAIKFGSRAAQAEAMYVIGQLGNRQE